MEGVVFLGLCTWRWCQLRALKGNVATAAGGRQVPGDSQR